MTAPTDPFGPPASSSGVKITEFEGQLLLITPHEVQKEIVTSFGPADATRCDVAVLDGTGAGESHEGVLVFQKALQGQLRANVGTGRMTLGRLGRGTAKPGQSAPWLLADPTDADKDLARRYLAKHQQPPF